MRDTETVLITTSESARILGCVPDNVRRLAREHQLRAVMVVGRNQRLFDRRDVEAFAAARVAARVVTDAA